MRLGVIVYSQTVGEASARRRRKASVLVSVVKRSAWLRKTANTPRCQNASPRCSIAPNDYRYLACDPVLKRYYACVVGFIGHLKIQGKAAAK
jgi:hypothetical protein